jgi:predicted Zn-dependent protease
MRQARLGLLLLLSGCATATQAVGYVGPAPAPAGKPAPIYADVSARVQAARPDLLAGAAAAARKDRGAAQQSLGRAQVALEGAVRTNPTSRAAAEALGMVYFYQGEAGDKSAYERCTTFLHHVVDVDPEAIQATRYLAIAYSRLSNINETITYANQAAAMSTDTAVIREMNALRKPYQDYFLSSWYEFGKYYESPAAKMTQYNPKTYQFDLVAQITPQFEQDLAAKGMQSMGPAAAPLQDAELQKYLQKLVDKLVAKTPGGPPFTYRVDPVESSVINAMALPGHIFVNTGLLKFTQSEAELVTVLSHEIGHIYAHHSARALVASYQRSQVASTILTVAKVNNTSLRDQLITMGAAIGLDLLNKGYSRQEEKEADKYGTHIAFNAGYNPTFMTKFFLRLYEANPKQPFKLLSTHPPTPERIEYTTQYLEAYPLDQEMQIDSQEFKDMKKRLR